MASQSITPRGFCKANPASFSLDAVDSPPASKYDLVPSIKEELHEYQWELALPGLSGQNYIVCAQTGTGKTRVAGLVISEHLQRHKNHGKVIFVVNKVPLVRQQKSALNEMIIGVKIEEVMGDVSQYKKAMLSTSLSESSSTSEEEEEEEKDKFNIHEHDIIVCTAGCLLNVLAKKNLSLSAISLLVIDECHNTHKKTDYAKIMEIYIQQKLSGEKKLPQVMGLTATPGAGDSARPTISTVLDHMTTLCAALDSTGGIKTVQKNTAELNSFQRSAVHTRAVLEGRSEEEPFIQIIMKIISILEDTFCKKIHPPAASKHSQAYIGWVNTTLQHFQENTKSRDTISTLLMLKCLSKALGVYYNLRYEDAMDVLDKFTLPSGQSSTDVENNLSQVMTKLKIKLSSLEKVENPLLKQLEDILVGQFESSPDSKAIIFVETKTQATSLQQWISSMINLRCIIRPDVVTGQTRNTGLKMTKVEQNAALDGFRGNEYNLLISTSVLEEGIDVPACNLVIRYQKVTSEVAQVQSKGRARASRSQSFSIMSSDSGKQYQELLNEEKILLCQQALELLPSGEALRQTLEKKQEYILKQYKLQEKAIQIQRKLYSPFEVELQCTHCSAFLCNGSDIHTIPTTLHHVITDKDIFSRILVKEHPNPSIEPHGLCRSHKLYCKHCGVQDLGVLGKWWKDHTEYPVIKCTNIKFIVSGKTVPCKKKKWKNAPFEIAPMN